MKTTMKITRNIAILLLIVLGLNTKAQQDPMYTQYMFNTQTINPAYAGSWETLSFMVLARQQWVGMDGAPETYSFSMQAPLKNERIALGLNVISDQLGLEKRFYMFGDYSYMVPITEKSKLRLGLKAGFTNYSNDLSQYSTSPTGIHDPSFHGEIDRKFMPNFGVGAFLSGEKYFVGFSIPKIVNNKFDNDLDNYSVESEMRHYYLTAGLVFDLGENIKFKPTMLTKATFSAETGAPVELDLTANFLIKEKFWLGAMYRSRDSFGFIVQWIFDEKLRIGYAYDIPTTNLHKVSSGSHEIMVSYELKYLKELVVSQRYF
jgi:type IX secretion system PorP/SprF family membrane protein